MRPDVKRSAQHRVHLGASRTVTVPSIGHSAAHNVVLWRPVTRRAQRHYGNPEIGREDVLATVAMQTASEEGCFSLPLLGTANSRRLVRGIALMNYHPARDR